MSTASGLSTEDHASNLFGTKGGGGLEAFFAPQNIAVIGATEKAGSIGRTIVWNLIKSPFGGTVFPVNPKRPRVLGINTAAISARAFDSRSASTLISGY